MTLVLLASGGVHTAPRLTLAPAASGITRYSDAASSSSSTAGSLSSYTVSPDVFSVTLVTVRRTFTAISHLPTRFPLRIREA